MTNGHFEFEVEGVKYSLHFGNIAVEQFTRLSIENMSNNITNETKSMTDMIFSGLFNSALLEGRNVPKYADAIQITDLLLDNEMDKEQEGIVEAFKSSRASQKQLEKLSGKDVKKKKK